jgi:hypothetical protein
VTGERELSSSHPQGEVDSTTTSVIGYSQSHDVGMPLSSPSDRPHVRTYTTIQLTRPPAYPILSVLDDRMVGGREGGAARVLGTLWISTRAAAGRGVRGQAGRGSRAGQAETEGGGHKRRSFQNVKKDSCNSDKKNKSSSPSSHY